MLLDLGQMLAPFWIPEPSKIDQKGLPGRPWTSWGPFWKYAYVLGLFLERFFQIFNDFGGPGGPHFHQFGDLISRLFSGPLQ